MCEFDPLYWNLCVYIYTIWTDEWNNFLQRIGLGTSEDPENQIFSNTDLMDKLREWASFRGQTLSRTGALHNFNCDLDTFGLVFICHACRYLPISALVRIHNTSRPFYISSQ